MAGTETKKREVLKGVMYEEISLQGFIETEAKPYQARIAIR
jgi:hypothetical protein